MKKLSPGMQQVNKALGIKDDDGKKQPRSRRSIFLALLDQETDCTDVAGNTVRLPLAEQVALAIAKKAAQGNVTAASFVFDNAYGKAPDVPDQETPKEDVNWAAYTEEELTQLAALIDKGYGKAPKQPAGQE